MAGHDESRDLMQGQAQHFRDDPYRYGSHLWAWAAGYEWRAYENVVGQPNMYPGFSDAAIDSILSSPAVEKCIADLARARVRTIAIPHTVDPIKVQLKLERHLYQVARKDCEQMVAKMDSARTLRAFGLIINNILVRMYHQGIHISISEFVIFRKAAVDAATGGLPMLLLPAHKSHIDYLTVSWLFFRLGLSVPHIVAGDNLNLPVVGSVLQKCGAFYIRRNFGDDKLYPTLVKTYIENLLSEGHNLECFIEGGRSRTGKLLPPKLGILKYVLEAVTEGKVRDVWICPISIQYDKVIETETYVNELLGNPKEKESLYGLMLNTRILQLKMGRIDVRFKQPWSLSQYIKAQIDRRSTPIDKSDTKSPSILPKFSPSTDDKDKVTLLRSLGYQVLADINSVAVIMPAALIGTVILTLRGRGVARKELIRRVDWLRKAIEIRGGRVAEFAGMQTGKVVDRALEYMKDLIGQQSDLLEPTFYAAKRFELSFYRNQVIHLFVSECFLSTALYTRVKAGGQAPSQRMKYDDVLFELEFLSRLLKNEFVYGTEGMVQNAMSTIQSLEKDQVILVEDDLIGLSPTERSIGRENFDFFCFMLWPFIETYWAAAVSLFALTPQEQPNLNEVAWYNEKEFTKRAQHFAKTLFYQGDVSYLEAVNQATLANAFERYGNMGVIRFKRTKGGKSIPLMGLSPDWRPARDENGALRAEGKLWDFLSRLGAFRREGKNRRDSSTVSSRVLALTEKVRPAAVQVSSVIGSDAVEDVVPAKL